MKDGSYHSPPPPPLPRQMTLVYASTTLVSKNVVLVVVLALESKAVGSLILKIPMQLFLFFAQFGSTTTALEQQRLKELRHYILSHFFDGLNFG